MYNSQAYINGQWHDTDNNFSVSSPLDGSEIASVSSCSEMDASAAIQAAQEAQKKWRMKSPSERASYLLQWEEQISKKQEEIAHLVHLEQGKVPSEAAAELAHSRDLIRWAASDCQRVFSKDFGSFQGLQNTINKRPIGVVGAITPWNFPIASVLVKAASALAAGCTVVLKPSELTPLCALALAAAADKSGLPAGVFNVIPTDMPAPIGELFCNDPRVDMLSFTGSSKVGKDLHTRCAQNMKHTALELGGNAPFLVLENADMSQVIPAAVGSKFFNAGQACVAANRFIIHQKRLHEFVDLIAPQVQAIDTTLNNHDGTIGPLTQSTAPERLDTLIKEAVDRGATELNLRSMTRQDHYYSPRILMNVRSEDRISREEIFGPVIAIQTFDEDLDGIEMANDTRAGLAAFLFGANNYYTQNMANSLNFGMIGCNTTQIFSPSLGFRGIKDSGCGAEGGMNSLDDYLQERNLTLGIKYE